MPDLNAAILKAAQSRSASYVCRYDGHEGWHLSEQVPRTQAYFRVTCKRIYVRSNDGQEMYFGRVEREQIIQDGTGKVTIVPQRRRR
jgi:hypothetical protein